MLWAPFYSIFFVSCMVGGYRKKHPFPESNVLKVLFYITLSSTLIGLFLSLFFTVFKPYPLFLWIFPVVTLYIPLLVTLRFFWSEKYMRRKNARTRLNAYYRKKFGVGNSGMAFGKKVYVPHPSSSSSSSFGRSSSSSSSSSRSSSGGGSSGGGGASGSW